MTRLHFSHWRQNNNIVAEEENILTEIPKMYERKHLNIIWYKKI